MPCFKCNDKGGFRGPYGWVRCECRKPTKQQREAARRLHAPKGYDRERDQLAFLLNDKKKDRK